jgi:hypothetical protein
MFQRILRNSALFLVSLAFSAVLLEVVLRWSGLFPVEGLHSVSARDYDRIPGFWEPGQDFVNRQIPALAHRIRTNSLGLRGPETTLTPRRPRVLCIGDSFTFGDYVDDEETLPAQLGDRLNGSAEVLNGGVGGTTIVDQRELLKRYLVLRPHVVLLVYFDNDLSDLLVEPPMHVWFARNRELKTGVLGPFYYQVRDTATFNALLFLQGVFRVQMTRQEELGDDGSDASPHWLTHAVDRYAAEVGAIRDLLEERGIELVVAAFPHPFVVSGKYTRDFIGPVSRALAQRQIQVVDFTPALRASGLPLTELFLFPQNGHASRRGYAIAAEVVEPHVRRALARRRGSG